MFNENQNSNVSVAEVIEMPTPQIMNPFEQITKHHSRSRHYDFISTSDLFDVFSQHGYNCEEINRRKTRKADKKGFEKHSFAVYGGETLSKYELFSDKGTPRIIVTNSHCGDSSLILRVGYFRRVCANGLLVSEDIFKPVTLRHRNLTPEMIMLAVEQVAAQYEDIMGYFKYLMDSVPTEAERKEYARRVAQSRLSVSSRQVESIENAEDLLHVNREEDQVNSWWHLINTVQENVVGRPVALQYTFKSLDKENKEVTKTRKTSEKPIRNIEANMKLNQACFSIANEILGIGPDKQEEVEVLQAA